MPEQVPPESGVTPEAMLEQAAAGTAVLEAAARRAAGDGGLAQPSALPNWSQAHVVAHVARNADALVNLLTWARTGVETPMYASREARAEQIEADTQRRDDELLADLVAANGRFAAAAAAAVGCDCWLVPVRTALGQPVPAGTVPWMRAREVWVHAVDLGAGVTLGDAPPPVAEALLDDVAASFAGRTDFPAVVLHRSGGGRRWVLGETAVDAAVEVTGEATSLAAYAAGRPVPGPLRTADGQPVPRLPAWL